MRKFRPALAILAAGVLVPTGQAEGVVRRHPAGRQRARGDRERLGGGENFSRRAALGNLALHHRHDRRACLTVQGEQEPLLGGLQDGWRGAALPSDVGQGGLGRQVVVPDVVVGHLEGPGQRPVGAVEGHHGIGVAVVSFFLGGLLWQSALLARPAAPPVGHGKCVGVSGVQFAPGNAAQFKKPDQRFFN